MLSITKSIYSMPSFLKKALHFVLFLGGLVVTTTLAFAEAPITIDVVGGEIKQQSLSLSFEGDPNSGVKNIIQNDLLRTGLFKIVSLTEPLNIQKLSEISDMQFSSDALLIASFNNGSPTNKLQITFSLFDTVRKNVLVSATIPISPSQERAVAHRIADIVYEKLIGEQSVFSTPIAYITKKDNRYFLNISDADGFNPNVIFSSNQPIMSPAWSPDGREIAYVSFEKRKPLVFIQSIYTGRRRLLTPSQAGGSSSPNWAPDGKKIAMAITRNGTTQVYLASPDNSFGITPFIKSNYIETEPKWSPDGKWVYFTSDRSGSPQIYRAAANGEDIKRITFEGDYNVSPAVSPDGRLLAYIQQQNGSLKLVSHSLNDGKILQLSNAKEDESPSFSPNGRMILYTSVMSENKGKLLVVSSNGKVKQTLVDEKFDVKQVVWGYRKLN